MKYANNIKTASTIQTMHNRTYQEKYQEFKVSEHLYHHLDTSIILLVAQSL